MAIIKCKVKKVGGAVAHSDANWQCETIWRYEQQLLWPCHVMDVSCNTLFAVRAVSVFIFFGIPICFPFSFFIKNEKHSNIPTTWNYIRI